MNDRTGDFITVLVDERPSHLVSEAPEPQFGQHRRGWHGDVFFDHVRGVIDPAPAPLVEPNPYLLVCHYRDFDWTSQHRTSVKEVASAAELVVEAQGLVASERASGSSNVELWEVYGVRIRERRPRPQRPRLIDGVDARLLEDIRNAPDDDAPRLVWADAVGGERGELVVIQIDLERGGLPRRETIVRKKRQRELLARHGVAWTGLAGLARRASFRRGFVDAAEIPAPVFLEHADDILEVAPLMSSLTTSGLRADGPASDPIPLLSKLCADPAIRELRGLDLHCETTDYVDDRMPGELALDIIVTSGLLRQLRALGSRDVLGMRGIRTLTNPHALHEIERLWLHEVRDAEAMLVLLSSELPALRSLDLGWHGSLAAFVPPVVTELFVHSLEPVAPLARALAGLEHLALEAGSSELSQFAMFPRLRSLWLHYGLILPEGGDAERALRRDLATRFFPQLREFANTTNVRQHGARLLAEQLGPQLDLLDLRNSPAALRHVNDLKARVAGELRVGDMHHKERHDSRLRAGLLRVGPTTQMPWWDHVDLDGESAP